MSLAGTLVEAPSAQSAPSVGREEAASRPIFILGVDRSGTSLISQLAYSWGAYPGEMDLLAEGNEGNPQGYWEYEPMEKFVSKLFKSATVSHWDPTFPDRLRERAFDPKFKDDARELIASMEKGPAWFWKEPYLCLCMPFFIEVLKRPIFIIPVRNPYESALSYEKFMLPPMLLNTVKLKALFLMRWQHFMRSALEYSAQNSSTIYVPYTQLLKQPREQCERLCRFLDEECGLEEGRSERVRKMSKVINPDLWRNRSDSSLADVPQATDAQRDLFDHLLGRVEDPGAEFDPDLYPMIGWWQEYIENVDLMLGLLNIE